MSVEYESSLCGCPRLETAHPFSTSSHSTNRYDEFIFGMA